MGTITALFFALAIPVVVLGLIELAYFPLSLAFERRPRRGPVFDDPDPLVSIIVPAYNEEKVIANCVESILADGYPHKEILLVDDGSTDDTRRVMCRYEGLPNVTVIAQSNGGKAAALNAGIARATGEVLFFVDADGIFSSGTVRGMLSGFETADVGAVCGNDEPVNLDRVQTRLLALLTHGTAFVRRALTRINCLAIVSGNLGAYRRHVIEEIGGFVEGFIGEDLELTWRVHRAGYRVNFRPRALVYAEVPSTMRALWKQRVRWTRGLVQTIRLHRDMMFTSRFGPVGWYLPFNVVTALAIPIIQLVALLLLAILFVGGASPISAGAMVAMLGLGLIWALGAICFSIALDRAWRDLRFLHVVPAWMFFSMVMSLVTAWALFLELRGAPANWNKFARTGVVSRTGR